MPTLVELKTNSTVIAIAPKVGGRIVQFTDRNSGYDFLWRNSAVPLRKEIPGADYDPNFFGGIDELLPNDIPEVIGNANFPDHGELWTAEFSYQQISESILEMNTHLPIVGFHVTRRIALNDESCRVETKITNLGSETRPFLWKLHVALAIRPGDEIGCDATRFSIADTKWSRRNSDGIWSGEIVPEFDNSAEFLYLSGLKEGLMTWRRGKKTFEVSFDPKVFKYAWYFASYGGFDGHEVAILEPATAMPISVNEAARLGQCSVLAPGASLETAYTYCGVVHEN